MKGEDFLKLEPSVREERKDEVDIQYKHVGKVLLKKHQQLYQFDPRTDELIEVKMEISGILKNGEVETHRKAMYDPACIYFAGWNMAGAKRHLERLRKASYKKYVAWKLDQEERQRMQKDHGQTFSGEDSGSDSAFE